MEDMEEDPLVTDIPPHVLFANDCLCAQGMGTEEVEATVEDMTENHRPQIPPYVLFVHDCLCAQRAGTEGRPQWGIWRSIQRPQIFLRMYFFPMIACVPRG